jgi:3-hydroxybutyryl-CoA dehydrogenase
MNSPLQTVGVVGAGVMGTGVAQAVAQAGLDVLLTDRSEPALATAERAITRGLRFQRLLAGVAPTEDRGQILKRIRYTRDLADLRRADFVIENVTEDEATKRPVYRRLDEVCAAECVFAANTSVIPITAIGASTHRPDRVLGMHFMNPVPLKPMVEVIRGYHTSDATVDRALDLLGRMGKEGIVVSDSPGFVTNRVLMLTINEACFLVQEGVAPVTDIDRIFRGCFGHKMGPLETADLIGLDTILLSIEGLYAAFADSKYRPCPLLRRMVDAGQLGRKSGQGFYPYGSAEQPT